jgi:multicomponent Na+:H+ antiporter subunit D
MIVGVLLAVGQWDLKRLLAYHSISQIGYVVLGLGLATPLGILGGLFHLFNHSVFKSLLFLNSGALEYSLGTRNLKEMGGLKDRMPVSAATSFIASMSIAGIPPFNGFWSKLIIILAAIQAGHPWYGFFACLASILTLASFMKVERYAFFGKLDRKNAGAREVPALMCCSMALLAVVCVAAGFLVMPSATKWFLSPAVGAVRSGLNYANIVLGAVK